MADYGTCRVVGPQSPQRIVAGMARLTRIQVDDYRAPRQATNHVVQVFPTGRKVDTAQNAAKFPHA